MPVIAQRLEPIPGMERRSWDFPRLSCPSGSFGRTYTSQSQIQGVVPYLTCLMDDPIGKEADWETNIGDKKHVNKCIN